MLDSSEPLNFVNAIRRGSFFPTRLNVSRDLRLLGKLHSAPVPQVSAYTSTKLGARGAEEKKLANPELFFWQRARASDAKF